ncbi:MAG: DegT/DnrJ/EryC1/StrS family aminotransferase [Lachnospiraceae bacterium]|nr:DegT/DnrJ/EryC1/StrS family aminotransferase [Lachnospiraceae bacterium]HAD55527.1 aminotransferase [Lachnospiraceae bacterium]
MSIFVTQSSMASWEEYIEEIKPIFETKFMTNMGPIYKKLQHQLEDYLKVPELSMFVNGHLALEMALQTMGFPRGSEVITTPYTFVSTTHAIARNGLIPVFCDINPDDYTIDVTKIEDLITEKTVAIVPVHVYGNICDVEAIQKIADRHNLKVIYDGAHAFGEVYKGRAVGTFGDMTMFSFHATKVFNTIEGGAVAYHDRKYREKLHELKNFGIHGVDAVDNIGGNAKMDEFRAAMGVCNLRYVDEYIAKRKAVAEKYDELLGDVKGIKFMKHRDGLVPNYSYYPIYVDPDNFGKTRDDVFDTLKEDDITARRYFYPASNDLDCYKDNYVINETPVAHRTSLNILCLPMYADLPLEDVERICDLIKGVNRNE